MCLGVRNLMKYGYNVSEKFNSFINIKWNFNLLMYLVYYLIKIDNINWKINEFSWRMDWVKIVKTDNVNL